MGLHACRDSAILHLQSGQKTGREITRERCKDAERTKDELRPELNDVQLETLGALERFGWELKSIRRPLLRSPIPVLFDGDGNTFAILKPTSGLTSTRPSLSGIPSR